MAFVVVGVLLLVLGLLALLAIGLLVRLVDLARAVGQALWRLVRALVVLAACVALGGLAGVAAAAIASTGLSDPALTGLAVGGATAVSLAVYSLRRLARETRIPVYGPLRWDREAPLPPAAPARPQLPPHPLEDASLAAAWSQAAKLLPGKLESQLVEARLACRLKLQHAEDNPHDLAAIDGATLVRRHVPALVQDATLLCEGADPAALAQHRADLLSGLTMIGLGAEVLRDERRVRLTENFETRLAHIRHQATTITVPLQNANETR